MINLWELQIGDWVYNSHHQKNIQITPYDFFVHGHQEDGSQYLVPGCEVKLVSGKDFIPIVLTSDILIKNGFVKVGRSYMLIGRPARSIVLKEVAKNYFYITIAGRDVSVDYVHELQHIFRSCKIEREIIL